MRLNTQLYGVRNRLAGYGMDFAQAWQWQPTLTGHDPAPPITLEDGVAAATYTFTGDVALTFGVAWPLEVVYAEPAAVALTFGVAAPLSAVYGEPASVALTFGVAAAQSATYAFSGDVALTLTVSAPFEFTAAVVETPPTPAGRAVQRPVLLTLPPAPVILTWRGQARFGRLAVASSWSAVAQPAAAVDWRGVPAPTGKLSVASARRGRVSLPGVGVRAVVDVYTADPRRREYEEELLLVGAL